MTNIKSLWKLVSGTLYPKVSTWIIQGVKFISKATTSDGSTNVFEGKDSNNNIVFAVNSAGVINGTISVATTILAPVISRLATPPVSPVEGDRYLIIATGSGAWVGKENQVAQWTSGAWVYTIPVADNTVFVTATLVTYRYTGTVWQTYAGTTITQDGNSLGAKVSIGSNDANALDFKTNNLERVTILSTGVLGSGLVGINKAVPTVALDVVGGINSSTDIIASNYIRANTVFLTKDGVLYRGTSQLCFIRFATGTGAGAALITLQSGDGSNTFYGAVQTIIDGTERLRVTKLGIGIENSMPNSIIDIGGTVARTIQVSRNITNNTAGNNLTISAGGATANGAISALSTTPTSGGIATYVIGDVLTLTEGTGGTCVVTNVSAGVVIGVSLVSEGSGYTVGTGKVTTGGGGTGCTVNIVTVRTGGTDKNGGNLILQSGISTGTGTSNVQLWGVVPSAGTGTNDNVQSLLTTSYATTTGNFFEANGTLGTFIIKNGNSSIYLSTTIMYGYVAGGIAYYFNNAGGVHPKMSLNGIAPTLDFELSQYSAGTFIGCTRNTGNAIDAYPLTIQAGGTKSGNTDKNGGILYLTPGISTGTAMSSIRMKRNSRAATTGTTDNTQSDALVIPSSKILTDNTLTSLFSIALPTLTSVGGMFSYVVKCADATDAQCESGIVLFSNSNKGGAFTSSIVKVANTQTMTIGTYTITFAITSADPSVIQITVDSSLNVASTISYNLLNKGEQDITQI